MALDVKVINHALEESVFQSVQEKYREAHWPETNHTIWSDDLYGKDCNVDITPIEPMAEVIDGVNKHLWVRRPPSFFSTQLFYRYHIYSYINWHVDKGYKNGYNGAYTLYLNDQWNRNWGGQLLFANGRFITPERNTLVIVPPDCMHSVAMIHKGAPNRMVLQGFIFKGERTDYES